MDTQELDRRASNTICVELTRIQAKKMKFLAEKGGKVEAVTLLIPMPGGEVLMLDSFGRATNIADHK